MKVKCLLPLPLLLVPFVDAADYLVRFKEGAAAVNTEQTGVSRIQTTSGPHPKFDYGAKELSLTLSLTDAAAIAHGQKDGHHNKSKAKLEAIKTFGEDNTSPSTISGTTATTIKSKGRWYTFDDAEFHIWHGEFSEEEAALLVKDASVDMLEKDIEIRFPELENFNKNKAAKAQKVKRLEQALNAVDEQLMELKSKEAAEEGDSKVVIPVNDDPKGTGKKSHEAKEYMSAVTTKDVPGPNNAYMIQHDAGSWGLPRVSQRNLPLSTDYLYPNAAGEGVDVYIVDTGINIDHVDFEGRARWGTTTVPGAPNTDDNGHGTFVAGVVGSHTFGVAKKVSLIAVKGLNKEGSSTLSQILAALDWVVKQNTQSSNRRNIVNLSLGAGFSKVLNSAVDTVVQAGMFIVAAAGNGNERNVGQNACNYSPASTPTAFTVGSTNIMDQLSTYSNFGSCVNIYAPGERVRSTWIGPTNREVNTDSGTSFSAPNVAGIAALIMSVEQGDRSDGTWSPRAVGIRILQLGTHNVIKNFKGPDNTNLLAFNGVGILGTTKNNGANSNGDNGSGSESSDNDSSDSFRW
ncbi:hypothetical protein BGZ98_003250 [Dissophora globulifera]|nr:hypothetical protein BGZ98_003250 [Dissophora globulifera]